MLADIEIQRRSCGIQDAWRSKAQIPLEPGRPDGNANVAVYGVGVQYFAPTVRAPWKQTASPQKFEASEYRQSRCAPQSARAFRQLARPGNLSDFRRQARYTSGLRSSGGHGDTERSR